MGVGLEELGVEEFVKGEFFSGELYIDTKKQAYKALGFRRLNIFNVLPSILSKKAREFNDRVKKENIPGDMKGDGFQNGGTLVVAQGGKLLLAFKQESPADHVDNEEVLKALGLTDSKETGEKTEGTTAGQGEGATGGQAEGAAGGQAEGGTGKIVCEEDVCKKE